MQTENFYSKIRENVENSDFTPEWDKSQVWQRIEQKQGKKTKPVWWKAIAAGIILVSLAGGYALFDNSSNVLADNAQSKKSTNAESTLPVSVETPVNEFVAAESAERELRVFVGANMHKNRHQPLDENQQAVPQENEIANEEFDNLVTTEEGVQEFSYNNITSRNEPAYVRPVNFDAPIIFRPNKPTEKPVTAATPAKRERVAILEIPEDEEDYVIAPKEKKKNRHARLAKQVEKTPEATDPNKPNKIWAFVKQSFKNETMSADSTIK